MTANFDVIEHLMINLLYLLEKVNSIQLILNIFLHFILFFRNKLQFFSSESLHSTNVKWLKFTTLRNICKFSILSKTTLT